MMESSWPEPASDAARLLPRAPAGPRSDLLLRQTFLRSYQFTVRESFKDRLRRNLKEAGHVGKAILSEIVDRVFDVRFGMRVFRSFRSRLHTAAMNPMGCFVPRKHCCLEDFA